MLNNPLHSIVKGIYFIFDMGFNSSVLIKKDSRVIINDHKASILFYCFIFSL